MSHLRQSSATFLDLRKATEPQIRIHGVGSLTTAGGVSGMRTGSCGGVLVAFLRVSPLARRHVVGDDLVARIARAQSTSSSPHAACAREGESTEMVEGLLLHLDGDMDMLRSLELRCEVFK
ncbi:hypothetical protein WOLCODRAFT_153333 [Wolfiporia cocos MD-104 SS10]|uniref:Uncharacterized protein n=1 Tax=Wolfiporia cocos (strain MD-104) TaxID=742152 RepID=A0A2H3JN10_WOLCO|nr:hypothetical protein WOLCODRAFT_153333 [Wolfiporia cocos MD-104 SS10]